MPAAPRKLAEAHEALVAAAMALRGELGPHYVAHAASVLGCTEADLRRAYDRVVDGKDRRGRRRPSGRRALAEVAYAIAEDVGTTPSAASLRRYGQRHWRESAARYAESTEPHAYEPGRWSPQRHAAMTRALAGKVARVPMTRKEKMMGNPQINVRMEQELLDRIEAYTTAMNEGRPHAFHVDRAASIRALVEIGLERFEAERAPAKRAKR